MPRLVLRDEAFCEAAFEGGERGSFVGESCYDFCL